MGLGQQQSKGGTSNALAKQVDADGKIKYDVIARYGHAQDKVSHSGFTILLFVKSELEVLLIGTGSIVSDVCQDARVINEVTRIISGLWSTVMSTEQLNVYQGNLPL